MVLSLPRVVEASLLLRLWPRVHLQNAGTKEKRRLSSPRMCGNNRAPSSLCPLSLDCCEARSGSGAP